MNARTLTRTTTLIPQWTLADRLRKAREFAEMEQLELAEVSGISRAAISNAERGSSTPHRSTLMLWAMATGVSLEWLMTGEEPSETEEAPAENDEGQESRLWDLNPRPVLYKDDHDPDPSDFALAS